MEEQKHQFNKTVHTIGHSNHSMEDFLNLLERANINVLVDVRTNPFTRYSVHFNHDPLKIAIQSAGLKYLFLGKELGGKPKEEAFYDDEGYLLYDRLAQSPRFMDGFNRLLKGLESYNIALMCGEENPCGCHRRLLIGRVLREHGVSVIHVRGNGEFQSEQQLKDEERKIEDDAMQLTLFSAPQPTKPWRSAKPKSVAKPPNY
jgi:uncharacterized protein (DUF488 family)